LRVKIRCVKIVKILLRGNKSKLAVLSTTEQIRCYSLATEQVRCRVFVREQIRCFIRRESGLDDLFIESVL
jgi:hypothetical protein